MSLDAGVIWEPLINIEAKLIGAEQASNSYKFFSGRLDRRQSENDDSTSVSSDSDCQCMTTDQIRNYILSQSNALYHDIPRLEPDGDYLDDELRLWSVIIGDFPQAATKIPVYASMMILNGIPPALRGLVWASMSDSHSDTLESLYDLLAQEWTPFVKIIGRDVHRTFPELSLFKSGAEGQGMLTRVLRAYSAYDIQVGYCQGLTFLAGPLLLHMSEKQAFCVLVKLMENYDLRSMFTADMAGLPLRIFQFERLFKEHLPELHAHFESLEIGSIYATQWFLSFYAVTCPLHMLVRLYDIMFAEGAIPTMMRVALSVLKRNQPILLKFDDEEQILERLLGQCLWDVYGFDADVLCAELSQFPSSMLTRIDQLQSQYVATGRNATRSKSVRKARSSSRRPMVSRLTSWMPVPNISPRASIRDCDSNMTVSSEEGDDLRSTLSCSSASSVVSDSMTFRATEDIKEQLTKCQSALDLERQEREIDKEAIEELLAIIDINAEEKEHDPSRLNRLIAQLREHLNLKSTSPDSTLTHVAPSCKSCDRLTMDLASIRAREVMARQEIDALTDRIMTLELELSTKSLNIRRPASPPRDKPVESLLRPLPKSSSGNLSRRWSILR